MEYVDINKRDEAFKELLSWVNRNSIDSELDTPDYILAELLMEFLTVYKRMKIREMEYYGRKEN